MSTRRSICIAALLALAGAAQAQVTNTRWDFNTPDDLSASFGPGELQYFDGVGGVVDANTSFGSCSSFGLPLIGGVDAGILLFNAAAGSGPSASGANGFKVLTGAQPNVAVYINEYTIIQDILVPASSFTAGTYLSFYNSNEANVNDGDLFADFSDGSIGISGSYQGALQADTWHRVAFSFKRNAAGTALDLRKYIDGVLVGTQNNLSGIDGRFTLYSVLDAGTEWYLAFADENGEQATFYVNSYFFTDRALTNEQIAFLGGASAGGPSIPPDAPAAFDLTFPVNGAVNVSFGPTLEWTAAPGAASYIVQVDNEPSFAPPYAYEASVTGTTAALPARTLGANTGYFWRAIAVNPFGTQVSNPANFEFRTSQQCLVDFNGDGNVDPDDLSDYISQFFSGNACP